MSTTTLKFIDGPNGRIIIGIETDATPTQKSPAMDYAQQLHAFLVDAPMPPEPKPEPQKPGFFEQLLTMAGYYNEEPSHD